MNIPADLYQLATQQLDRSYAPYSRFAVAAAIRFDNDIVVAGCNVENASYPVCLCAEANAISTGIAKGGKHIQEALILTATDTLCPPCGACRQILSEFVQDDCRIWLCNNRNKHALYQLSHLLPVQFAKEILAQD